MISTNPLNTYTGSNSLRDYYNPDKQPLLPLVEIPECLNPFRPVQLEDGVRIYAKMMTMLPAHNVKALPALNMLASSVVPDQTKTIIEYSSGSTILSMSIVGRVFHGITDTRAYLSNKTSETKLRLMRFFGLDISLFGGPSQPEPRDSRGGIQTARKQAEDNGEIANANQYENYANWESHYRWTAPQIFKQLPEVNVVCAGMGTSGTMTGIGTFFREKKSSVKLVACCTAPGQRIPGPRTKALLEPVEFPWHDAIDQIEEVGEVDSYSLSMELSREGLICGPSSGFNLKGLYQMLEKRKLSGSLDELRNKDGFVHCVFICCDLPYQYIDEYFTKLDESSFPRIHNANLIGVDRYRYGESWELEPADALAQMYRPLRDSTQIISSSRNLDSLPGGLRATRQAEEQTIVLDLRMPSDFANWHFPSSRNLPLKTLNTDTASPFENAAILEEQWLELDEIFRLDGDRVRELQQKRVLTLCYDGDTSRVATSIMRAKGIDACSIGGGLRRLSKSWRALAEQKSEGTSTTHNGKAETTPDVGVDVYDLAKEVQITTDHARPVLA